MEQKIDPTGLDAYKPAEVALRIEEAGVKKAALAAIPLLTLSVLAGAFIALGAAGFTAVLPARFPTVYLRMAHSGQVLSQTEA